MLAHLAPAPPWVLGCASPSPRLSEKVPAHVVDLEKGTAHAFHPGSGTGQRRDLKGLKKMIFIIKISNKQ